MIDYLRFELYLHRNFNNLYELYNLLNDLWSVYLDDTINIYYPLHLNYLLYLYYLLYFHNFFNDKLYWYLHYSLFDLFELVLLIVFCVQNIFRWDFDCKLSIHIILRKYYLYLVVLDLAIIIFFLSLIIIKCG